MGYSRKNPNRGRGLRIYFFENPHGIFHFFTLPLKIPDKKLNPWIFHEIVLDPLEIPRPKTRTLGNYTSFFLVTLGNSALFLIHPWKFHMLFLWYPWKFHILNPPVWIFPRIAQCPINFSLNMLGTGLLYLLDIVMNSSFISVHHLVCHLDLN